MKYQSDLPQLRGLDFSKKEISRCIENNSLLRISIEVSTKCNLNCPFCYVNKEKLFELSLKQIKKIINEAKRAGAKTITLVGGEPLIYPEIKKIIEYINKLELIPLIFTNGTVMNDELAEILYINNASLIVKFNSLDDPKIQDEMVGNVDGTFDKIRKTLRILKQKGFNKSEPTRLAIETVISKQNLAQIPKIFRFARKHNIYPYIELITPAKTGNQHYKLNQNEAKNIFNRLLEIDQTEFGHTWIPRPPQVASTCKYYFTALYITSKGSVQPCPTVTIKLGDINRESIQQTLNKPTTKNIRDIRKNIKGKCKTCEHHTECYGCRGAAFNSKGDIFEEDPGCWV